MTEYKQLFDLAQEEVKTLAEKNRYNEELSVLIEKENFTVGQNIGEMLTESMNWKSKVNEINFALEVLKIDIPRKYFEIMYKDNDSRWNWVDLTKKNRDEYLDDSDNFDKFLHTWKNIGKINYDIDFDTYLLASREYDKFIKLAHIVDENNSINIIKLHNNVNSCFRVSINFDTKNYRALIKKLENKLVGYKKSLGQSFVTVINAIIDLSGDHHVNKVKITSTIDEINQKLADLAIKKNEIMTRLDLDQETVNNISDNISERSYTILSEI